MKERLHYEDNHQGWLLEIRQYWDPERLDRSRRPLLIIPGYCMNTFILNYHPSQRSMVAHLVDEGFEVFTANLRGQGGSRRLSGSRRFGFREVALVDIPTVMHFVQATALSEPARVDAIGCSLGATYLYAYLAHHPNEHVVGSLVGLGGPLRWESAHPLLPFIFASPRLAGMLPVIGTRKLAQTILPIARRIPKALDLYMNRQNIDLSQAGILTQTIDDPIPYLNRQIAHWVRHQDLHVAGVNVTEAMGSIETPTLCIAANSDGIVPPDTAFSILDAVGTDDVLALEAGDQEHWFAHADLFINDYAEREVFDPLATWLADKA